MTLDYQRRHRLPASRFFPLICLCAWVLFVPTFAASPLMNLGSKTTGMTILSWVGLAIPLAALGVGLHAFLQIKRIAGVRDRFLSWCLAANCAILLLFAFFLLLIWPVILKSP